MVVHDVRLLLRRLHRRRRNQLVLRIMLSERTGNLREARIVAARLVKPVLIANLDIVQRKRRWMTVTCALSTPLRIHVSGNVLHFVDRRLHERLKVGAGIDMLAA